MCPYYYCRKCGTELDETAKFCPACGTPVAAVVPATEQTAPERRPVYVLPVAILIIVLVSAVVIAAFFFFILAAAVFIFADGLRRFYSGGFFLMIAVILYSTARVRGKEK